MPPARFTLALIALTFANFASAQDRSSQIISQGSATTLQVEPDIVSRPGTFPALVVTENDAQGETTDPASVAGELTGPAITVIFSLVVVLGLFAALVWTTRRFGSRSLGGGAIPKEVVQSLGSLNIDPRTRIALVRCGRRILVLSQSQTEMRPLAEITDADEVREITAACLGDSKQSFDAALQSIEREKTAPGYLGSAADTAPTTRRQRSRLFATA